MHSSGHAPTGISDRAQGLLSACSRRSFRDTADRREPWHSDDTYPYFPPHVRPPPTARRRASRVDVTTELRSPGQERGGAVILKPGDRVIVEAESTERRSLGGVIEEVVREEPPRYRIRWDDGRESIYSPAAGAQRKAESTKTK